MFELNRAQRLLHRLARWLVIGAAVLSPWLFGSSEPCAYLIISLGIMLAVAFCLFSLAVYPQTGFRVPALTLTLFLLMGFILLQIVPLSLPVVRMVSPFAVDMIHVRDDLFRETGAEAVLPDIFRRGDVRATLSMAPLATVRSACLFAAYLGAFWVMANSVRRWHHIRNAATALVGGGFLMAVIALIQRFSGSSEMLWFYTPPHGGNFVGTFTNRNHFAFHMTLLFAIALGLFLSSSRFHEVLQKTDWRERLEWMSTERASRLALLIFAIALMGGAICISLSRGAITSLSAAMGIVGIVSGVYGRHGILRRILWGIVLLVVAVVVWLGWQPVVGRLAEFSSLVDAPLQDSRIAGTRSTLMVLGASPVLGCGFGAFRHVFPLFQTSDIQFGRWLHAHNDWAQLLAEGGGVGGFLFILAVVFFCGAMRSLFPGAITRARLFVLGLWVGIVAVALHSLVDYSLHKPANALLLAVLCGLAVSALHLQAGAREEDGVGGALPGSNSHDPEHAADRDEWAQHRTGRDAGRMLFVRGGAFAGLVLLTFVGLAELSMLRGELAFARFRYEGKLVEKSRSQDVEKNVAEAMNDLELILRGGWGVPDTLLDSTETCFRWAIDDRLPAATRLVAAEKAGQLAASTVYVSPSDYLAWMWLARSQALLGQWEAADLSFGRARALAPDSRETVLFLRNR